MKKIALFLLIACLTTVSASAAEFFLPRDTIFLIIGKTEFERGKGVIIDIPVIVDAKRSHMNGEKERNLFILVKQDANNFSAWPCKLPCSLELLKKSINERKIQPLKLLKKEDIDRAQKAENKGSNRIYIIPR